MQVKWLKEPKTSNTYKLVLYKWVSGIMKSIEAVTLVGGEDPISTYTVLTYAINAASFSG